MMLKTNRLILRQWNEEDAEELYKYACAPEIGLPAGWLPHTSVENSREIIRDVLSASDTFAVCLKDDRKPIGSIGFHRNDLAENEDEYELGYWIGKPFWGRGLIPEASREMLRYAFEDLQMNRIWGGYYDGNDKSCCVLQKLGFVYHHKTEGIELPHLCEIRTGHVMLLTKETWMNMVYCEYLDRCIDQGICYDIQMIFDGYILPSALPELEIDKSMSSYHCKRCNHASLKKV